MPVPDWFPDWAGQTIVIVGSGPSASDVPLDLGRGLARFIAINESWRLCRWAEMLLAGDAAWWQHNRGCPEFAGIKVTVDQKPLREEWGVKRLVCGKVSDRMEFERLGRVGWGGNSGFCALNLAAQLKPARILLVGLDMRLDHGAHWHGPHKKGLGNPRLSLIERWRRAIDGAASELAAVGIHVVNCSPTSALRAYPKMGFAQALVA